VRGFFFPLTRSLSLSLRVVRVRRQNGPAAQHAADPIEGGLSDKAGRLLPQLEAEMVRVRRRGCSPWHERCVTVSSAPPPTRFILRRNRLAYYESRENSLPLGFIDLRRYGHARIYSYYFCFFVLYFVINLFKYNHNHIYLSAGFEYTGLKRTVMRLNCGQSWRVR
jgi:hypothetical protein